MYGIDKFSFGNIETSVMFIEGFMLMIGGWLPYIWDKSIELMTFIGLLHTDISLFKAEVYITIGFIFIMSLHDILISLPFELYRTFVIEEKHGFNTSVSKMYIYAYYLNVLIYIFTHINIKIDSWVISKR